MARRDGLLALRVVTIWIARIAVCNFELVYGVGPLTLIYFAKDRGFDRSSGYQKEQLPLPTKPPFTAHLGNLPFDAAEGDIQDFFADCSVTNVRIVEDRIEKKPKGFGYVEFATLDGLKKALDQGGSQFQGRNIRVSVAEPRKC